jgi:hypothetical protein
MALTRVTGAGIADGALTVDDIADGAIHTAKLADSAIHTAKIANDAVHTGKIADDAITPAKVDETGSYTISELTISGTTALQVPTGTEAQRPSSPTNGLLRFNTTAGKLEVYNTLKVKWEAAGGGGGGASAGLAYFASGW